MGLSSKKEAVFRFAFVATKVDGKMSQGYLVDLLPVTSLKNHPYLVASLTSHATADNNKPNLV
jgi:hypothetical protein